MILLAEECLVLETAAGEGMPYSAEMISVELIGGNPGGLDPDQVRHAAAAVFHYFRNELGRDTVSVSEFTEALEKVLDGGALGKAGGEENPSAPVPETDAGSLPAMGEAVMAVPGMPPVGAADLRTLVQQPGEVVELFFFPRLREELRAQLRQSPHLLRFQGLRPCVKQLVGVRRWTPRCQKLEDQIIDYLRYCAAQDATGAECALLVQ